MFTLPDEWTRWDVIWCAGQSLLAEILIQWNGFLKNDRQKFFRYQTINLISQTKSLFKSVNLVKFPVFELQKASVEFFQSSNYFCMKATVRFSSCSIPHSKVETLSRMEPINNTETLD